MMRDFPQETYKPSWWAPPPLHTYNPACQKAAWYPLEPVKDAMLGQHAGPVMVTIPTPAPAELGDDPTDATRQHRPRLSTTGMFGRLHEECKRERQR